MTENDNISRNADQTKSRGRDDVLMDYDQLAEELGIPATPPPAGPHIGLSGGQSKDDRRGDDMSQFENPDSKASAQLKDPHEHYHSGPGNGLSSGDYNDRNG